MKLKDWDDEEAAETYYLNEGHSGRGIYACKSSKPTEQDGCDFIVVNQDESENHRDEGFPDNIVIQPRSSNISLIYSTYCSDMKPVAPAPHAVLPSNIFVKILNLFGF